MKVLFALTKKSLFSWRIEELRSCLYCSVFCSLGGSKGMPEASFLGYRVCLPVPTVWGLSTVGPEAMFPGDGLGQSDRQ